MILSWSWISLACLSRSVITLSWPSFCVLRNFFRLFDVSYDLLVYFLMSSLVFILMVLHVSAYSIHCFSSPFSTISRCFVNRARVGDDMLDFSGLLIALATLDALCWIMSVMVSLIMSMSSSPCRISNRFLNLSWNSIFFDLLFPAYIHTHCI